MKKKYIKRIKKILEEKWGFSSLKDKQLEIDLKKSGTGFSG